MIFTRAIIHLTAAFAIVQLLLFAAFAIGVYAFVTGTFDFDAAENDGDAAINAAEQGFATLRTGLIVSYCILVLVVPAVSFLMAHFALRPIRRSYDAQTRFVDGASHELRTPLSIIQGELELVVRQRRTAADYEAAIAIALEELSSLTDLTNDLLLLSHTDGRYPSTAMMSSSLKEIAFEASKQENFMPVLRSPPVDVAIESTANVRASRALILRATINLIDNALKFSAEGGTVTVTVENFAGHPAITVKDSGIGMTPAALAHATDRFWRAEEARTRPGHGLGLALVQQIMEAHGGTLAITSTPGAGTVARLIFARSHG